MPGDSVERLVPRGYAVACTTLRHRRVDGRQLPRSELCSSRGLKCSATAVCSGQQRLEVAKSREQLCVRLSHVPERQTAAM